MGRLDDEVALITGSDSGADRVMGWSRLTHAGPMSSPRPGA